MKGIVFDIQKFSLHDGPGIRTTVFLKGCNMRCAWCHNPESFIGRPQIGFDAGKCGSCGKCVAVCPEGAHALVDGGHVFDSSRCRVCGLCAAECMHSALRVLGREMTVDEVVGDVLKDRKYYESSGGGVTFSGGEATMQADFLLALLEALKGSGVHNALETNGVMPNSTLQRIAPWVDLFLFDYKLTDPVKHRIYTGVEHDRVLESLERLDSMGARIVLRCPIIPGVNDDPGHFGAIRSLRERFAAIESVEVMPYHNTGRHKWGLMGMPYSLENLPSATADQRKEWESLIS